MVGIAAFALVLAAPAAPVPAQPPVPAPQADRFKAVEFARTVCQAGEQVAVRYVKPVEMKDLIEAAARGMYEECGLPVPDRVLKAIRDAGTALELVDTLADVRLLLANQPALRGPRALYAAINGFRHATEPLCQLVSPRANTFASIDMDFGIGIELEGVGGAPWMLYQVEYKTAQGHFAPVGWLEPVPRLDAVNAPAGVPWRIKRVIAESPAQKAGVKPHDIITHFNGTEVTAESVNKLFAQFAFPPQMFDRADRPADGPRPHAHVPPRRRQTVHGEHQGRGVHARERLRGGADERGQVGLPARPRAQDRLHPHRGGRIGAGQEGRRDARGPGPEGVPGADPRPPLVPRRIRHPGGADRGHVSAAGRGDLTDEIPQPEPAATRAVIRNPFTDTTRYTSYPLVVLVGSETTGGGELIASALRDNDRCVLMGQRTVGRSSIQEVLPQSVFGGLYFKVTTGESFRPNGKARQRKPDSGPNDEWGLKPDDGLDVPVTKDKSAELRRWAELHSLRPFDSTEALDFDDPAEDPYRVKALDYLRKKLGKPK